MTAEQLTAFASVGTFVVIAATSIAAVIQLRHMRGGNQLAALNHIQEAYESESFKAAQRYLSQDFPALVSEPEYRRKLYQLPAPPDIAQLSVVGNHYETMATLVKNRILDATVICDLFAGPTLLAWNALLPVIAARRHVYGPLVWENFEYLAVLAQDWFKRHPRGAYPSGLRRMAVEHPLIAEDIAAGTAPPYEGVEGL